MNQTLTSTAVHVLGPKEPTEETLYTILGEVKAYKPELGVIEIEIWSDLSIDPPIYVAAQYVPEWMRITDQVFEVQVSLDQTDRERFCLRILEQVGSPEETFEDIIKDLELMTTPTDTIRI